MSSIELSKLSDQSFLLGGERAVKFSDDGYGVVFIW